MRRRSRAAVLTLGIAAALTVAAPPIGAGSADPIGAAATIAALPDGAQARDRLPGDFEKVMGYEPALAPLADGSQRLINPSGACSVPGHGQPFDFTVACQAHDFGYDLLRYAQRTDADIPGTARDDIDNLLSADLRRQCLAHRTPATCEATVKIFAAGVRFNSWRQVSGPPVDQSGLPRTAGLVLLGGIGLFSWQLFSPAAGFRRRRGVRWIR